jgi:hypothetical protein
MDWITADSTWKGRRETKKEVVVAYFNILSKNLHEGTERSTKNVSQYIR